MMEQPLPKIAIVGRPNVGKSSLFNRLVGFRRAIVDDIPGVTRDRQYGEIKLAGKSCLLIDTGGFVPGVEKTALPRAVRSQVYLAVEEADLVWFVVDGRTGITPAEEEIARWLRKQDLPVLLVINKIDTPRQESLVTDFLKLGFPEVFPVSAEAGRGLKELEQASSPHLRESAERLKTAASDLRLAIIGQPNVGKSTLINALTGSERAVVHHEAGTTLDPLDIRLERGSMVWEFVDTAGIKRRRSTSGKVEKVGVIKALDSIRRSHLVLLLVDATQGLGNQDMKILAEAEKMGRAMILVFNKWDQMPSGFKIKTLTQKIQDRYRRQENIPTIAISAKTKRGLGKLFKLVDEVQENFWRRIGTGELNRVFQKALKDHPPPTLSGKFLNMTYATQSREGPPRFVLFVNHPKLVPESYLRYLERVFRKNFSLTGVPIQWQLKKKN